MGSSKLQVKKAVSAGGVVLRKTEGRVEVLICNITKRGIWALPKGTPDSGESIMETAVREVREETGIESEIKLKIGSINYWFKQEDYLCNKTVYFFLMVPKGGKPELHDPEFDIVEWTSLDEAYKKMSYKNEIKIVQRAVNSFE